jgi:hypothetical protein
MRFFTWAAALGRMFRGVVGPREHAMQLGLLSIDFSRPGSDAGMGDT